MISSVLRQRLVAACRTGIGDELRGIILVAPGDAELLYLRRDLALRGNQARELRHGIDVAGRHDAPSDEHWNETKSGPHPLVVRAENGDRVARFSLGRYDVVLTAEAVPPGHFADIHPTVATLVEPVAKPAPA